MFNSSQQQCNKSLKADKQTSSNDTDEVDTTVADKAKAVVLEEIRDGDYYLKVQKFISVLYYIYKLL